MCASQDREVRSTGILLNCASKFSALQGSLCNVSNRAEIKKIYYNFSSIHLWQKVTGTQMNWSSSRFLLFLPYCLYYRVTLAKLKILMHNSRVFRWTWLPYPAMHAIYCSSFLLIDGVHDGIWESGPPEYFWIVHQNFQLCEGLSVI